MRILIADDDEDGFVPICAALEHDGYVVIQAFDGEAALQQLSEDSFDIAIVDLDMPKRDGASLVRELRARSVDIPIVLASGNGNVRQVARQLGIEHSLAKPFGIDELTDLLKKLGPTPSHGSEPANDEPSSDSCRFPASEAATQIRLRYVVPPAKAEGDG